MNISDEKYYEISNELFKIASLLIKNQLRNPSCIDSLNLLMTNLYKEDAKLYNLENVTDDEEEASLLSAPADELIAYVSNKKQYLEDFKIVIDMAIFQGINYKDDEIYKAVKEFQKLA
jgi:hypothetical protein